jgi:dTDP-glucose pyrophosphorylase
VNDRSQEWLRVTLTASHSLRDGISAMTESGIQIILVVDDLQKLLGTITDGDVRRALLSNKSMESSVLEFMHLEPIVVLDSTSRETVIQLMKSNKVQHIPIINSSRTLIGLHVWANLELPDTRKNKMVIMAGGKGTRMLPQTLNRPKPMLEIAGKPMLEHIIVRARSQGFANFVISINYLGHVIEDYFKNGERFGVNIQYIKESEPLGTAGALSLLKDIIEEPVVVTNGDVITDVNYAAILNFHMEHKANITIAVRDYSMQNPFGVVSLDGLQIIKYEEKPVAHSHINAGVYVLSETIISSLQEMHHLDMSTLVINLLERNHPVIAFPIHESWMDVGHPRDLQRANLREVTQHD